MKESWKPTSHSTCGSASAISAATNDQAVQAVLPPPDLHGEHRQAAHDGRPHHARRWRPPGRRTGRCPGRPPACRASGPAAGRRPPTNRPATMAKLNPLMAMICDVPVSLKASLHRLRDAAFHTQQDACHQAGLGIGIELEDRLHRALAQAVDSAPQRVALVALDNLGTGRFVITAAEGRVNPLVRQVIAIRELLALEGRAQPALQPDPVAVPPIAVRRERAPAACRPPL